MGVIGYTIVGVVVVVLFVALAYDLWARRRRRLAAEFNEAARTSAIDAKRGRSGSDARSRPNKMGRGPTGGPSLGP